jgi:ribosomal protein L14E/L6E/L27E
VAEEGTGEQLLNKELVGWLVRSKIGRDSGKLYIVADVLDDFHVALMDGQKFNFTRRKRKNKKHLWILTKADADVVQGIMSRDEKCLPNIFKLLELEAKEV